MKLVVLVFLVAACHAIDLQSQKAQDDKMNKREVSQANSAINKRAPAISTVSPAITPGIEYADSKESQQDKSPTHQVYASPLPPVSKISDVLTGDGPGFQSAIASHLYAPVSVYQPRLGSPTTYEVSQPVPSNLAYAEHRVSLQPIQNALQLNQKPIQKSNNDQQILVQQPLSYSQEIQPIAQQIYHQVPQVQYQEFPINQFQVPLYSGQQPLYQNQPVQIAPPAQAAAVYSSEPQKVNHPQSQRELKPQLESKTAEKQVTSQNYVEPKGAVSYKKFAQLQPISLQPQQEIQYQAQLQPQIHAHLQPQFQLQQQPQPQPQLRYHQPQAQYQQQPQYQPQQPQYQPQQPQFQLVQQPQIQYQPYQQYQILPQNQPLQYQFQPEVAHQQSQAQLQSQSQIQYQLQPQLKQQLVLAQTQQSLPVPQQQHQQSLQQQYQKIPQHQIHLQPISKASNGGKETYVRPGSTFLQSQNHETPDYRNNVALPTFPPVQYFGKYAQSIFGNLQH